MYPPEQEQPGFDKAVASSFHEQPVVKSHS